MGKYLFLT